MGDRKKIGVESDEFRIVVDCGGGDDQVQGACIESLIMAFLAEPCGIAPDARRRRENWQGGELRLDLGASLRDGVADSRMATFRDRVVASVCDRRFFRR